jgi:hypothetical protein
MLGKGDAPFDTDAMGLRRTATRLLVLFAFATVGCSTYHDQLARSQKAFDQNEHDRALALLRDLEPNLGRLPSAEQAQYAYLRGMSDYRIGYRTHARHWLAIAKAYEDASPGALPADWKTRTNEALSELNDVVYADGVQALGATRAPEDHESPPEGASDDDTQSKSTPKSAPR